MPVDVQSATWRASTEPAPFARRLASRIANKAGSASNAVFDAGPMDRETVRAATAAACHAFLQFSLDHPVLFEMAVAQYRPANDSAPFTLGTAMSQDGSALVAAGLVDAERVQELGSALYVALRGVAAVAEESPRLVANSTEPHLLLDQVLDALLFAYAPTAQRR